ncbi:4-amino-4-deoxy-L-arabinose transferase [Nocardioides scoriae]|uniref:4-amino-4-deoxy-L-arabinose transferase n=1 Tax=Nocardioides scoriae TaxID=642780 RepID=A0A1H1VQ16_9ACTN|nr:hypothetical protein [Nocardioides scoriae]SDS86590.1 4-amino-4-deoxy-L-arabinose transferase [Nocardioides scoriae]
MATLVRDPAVPTRAGTTGGTDRSTPDRDTARTWPARAGVASAALAVVLLRLPFLDRPLTPDESGFMTVGGQWLGHGPAADSSLYGRYWVDRPPLLVTVFGLADRLGGAVPLRLVGVLAAVVVVLAVARTSRVVTGRPAAGVWSAVVAALLLGNPLAGSLPTNGELVAAPFVAVGVAAVVESVRGGGRTHRLVAGLVAGAAAVCAVMVKQNMADVGVLALVVLVLTVRHRGPAFVTRTLAAMAAGALATGLLLAGWTVAHGTSLGGVWFAMYPFRVEAGAVLAGNASLHALARSELLLQAATATGMVALALLAAWGGARHVHRRGRRGPGRVVPSSQPASVGTVLVGLALVGAYDVASIALGGSYWLHYLVQLVVPLSVATGLVAVRHRALAGVAVAWVAVSALVVTASVASGASMPTTDSGVPLGRAVGAAARPGDTVVTLWGHADVTRATGLVSPYPYLWALPTRTLDPQLHRLVRTLRGPDGPTWVVAWSRRSLPGVDPGPLREALRDDYHPVLTTRAGHTVFLHDGVVRPDPRLAARFDPPPAQEAR